MQPKSYQTQAVDTLVAFLRRQRAVGLAPAFREIAGEDYLTAGLPAVLLDIPYVCFRIPTGGGKTLMGALMIGPVLQELQARQTGVVLWLVPSTAIKTQTINRLQDPTDPYRRALEGSVKGPVRVMDLDEAFALRRAECDTAAIVIVGTIQQLRREDTDQLRVYEPSGDLADHFSHVPAHLAPLLVQQEEGRGPVPCLVNALALQRPLVICDEAHNARTALSLDTIARLLPSCILEMTATPQREHDPVRGIYASNVLFRVSAVELKLDDMIKLPIDLRVLSNWEEALAAALVHRDQLEQAAHEDPRRIRPILLLQAQPARREGDPLTVDVLRAHLIERELVPENYIAIETGDRRELAGVDLTARDCQVRVILTVQALREGWDCPWAYVLCSLNQTGSLTAAEQLLGRVLRMPNAQRSPVPALNKSYAVVVSESYGTAADSLVGTLIANGFEKFEATRQVAGGTVMAELWGVREVPVETRPALEALPPSLAGRVTFNEVRQSLTIPGQVTPDEMSHLLRCVPGESAREALRRDIVAAGGLFQPSGDNRVATDAAEPVEEEQYRVPYLTVKQGDVWEVFRHDHFLSEPWPLSSYDPTLHADAFDPYAQTEARFSIDIDHLGDAKITPIDAETAQVEIAGMSTTWTVSVLSGWLDRHIQHIDIRTEEVLLFLRRMLAGLIEGRGIPMAVLVRARHRLQVAAEALIDQHRTAASKAAFQASLFGPTPLRLRVTESHALSLSPDTYVFNKIYTGAYQFRKHLFEVVGDLESSGEEFECACQIDSHPSVRKWVRNTDSRPKSSFWLQTPFGKFYPDFLAFLQSGEVVAIEYKGTHLYSADDATLKRQVGAVWADLSEGKARFVMLNGPEWEVLRASLAGA